MKHQKLLVLVLCALAITVTNAQRQDYESYNDIGQWDKHRGNMNHNFGIQKQPFRHGFDDKPYKPDYQFTIPIGQPNPQQNPNPSPFTPQDLETINTMLFYGISIALICVAISMIKLCLAFRGINRRRHQMRNLNNFTQQHQYVNFDQRPTNRIQSNLNLDDKIAFHKQQLQKLQLAKKSLEQKKRRQKVEWQLQIKRENMRQQQMRRQQQAKLRQEEMMRKRQIQMSYPRGIPINNYHYPVYNSHQFHPHPIFANKQPLHMRKQKNHPQQHYHSEQIEHPYHIKKGTSIEQIPSIPVKQDNDSSFASEYPEI